MISYHHELSAGGNGTHDYCMLQDVFDRMNMKVKSHIIYILFVQSRLENARLAVGGERVQMNGNQTSKRQMAKS